MSSKPKKYIFENGIMKSNPEYVAYMASLNGSSPPQQTNSGVTPLTIVSSMADIAEATTIQAESTGVAMQVCCILLEVALIVFCTDVR